MTVIRSRRGGQEGANLTRNDTISCWLLTPSASSPASRLPWLVVTQHLSQSHNFLQKVWSLRAIHNITIFQNLNAWTFWDRHLPGGQSAQPLLLPKLHRCLPGPAALHRGHQGRALRYYIWFQSLVSLWSLICHFVCLDCINWDWGDGLLQKLCAVILLFNRVLVLRLHP